MISQHVVGMSRREFLGGLTLAATAGLLGLQPRRVAVESPLETTLRLARTKGLCFAPLHLAEDLLLGSGPERTTA